MRCVDEISRHIAFRNAQGLLLAQHPDPLIGLDEIGQIVKRVHWPLLFLFPQDIHAPLAFRIGADARQCVLSIANSKRRRHATQRRVAPAADVEKVPAPRRPEDCQTPHGRRAMRQLTITAQEPVIEPKFYNIAHLRPSSVSLGPIRNSALARLDVIPTAVVNATMAFGAGNRTDEQSRGVVHLYERNRLRSAERTWRKRHRCRDVQLAIVWL
jgi:hypothetical protein